MGFLTLLVNCNCNILWNYYESWGKNWHCL